MPKSARHAVLVLATGLLTGPISACGDKGTVDTASECSLPVASAGADSAGTLGATVTLDASASTICSVYATNGSATYTWKLDRVPAGSRLDDSAFSVNGTADAAVTTFTPDVEGDYVASITITDPSGTSGADVVVITMESGNLPPIADCGGDHTAQVDDRVELDGSASSDPELQPLTWQWSLATAPDCSSLGSSDLYDSDQTTSSIVPDCEGIFVVSLVVSDGERWSEPAYCTVDVANGNRIPEAVAGPSEELPYCAPNPITLNAWGSFDLDGDELSYLWTVASVPGDSSVSDADFDDATRPDASIAWDVPGSYTFELQVYDGQAWSSPDVVTYTFAGSETNTAPIANAGSDAHVDAIGDCTSSSYVWTCGDCPEASAFLDGSSTYDPDGDMLTYFWSEATGTATFSNNASAVTDIIFAPQPSEFGVSNELQVEATLTARDCLDQDSDSVNVTYTCTGQYLGD